VEQPLRRELTLLLFFALRARAPQFTIPRVNHTDEQPTFEPPKVVDYGDLAEITAGQTAGSRLDATFPVGTPTSGLTFS
jgi:hypothetical protein